MEFHVNNPQEEKDKKLQKNLSRIKHKLIVISGKGGVGKSTVSVNLAYGLVLSGKKVGILDVDIHGPSLGKMLGIEGRRLGLSEDKTQPAPIKVYNNLYALTIANLLESKDSPVIWRGPLKMGAIRQFLQDIEWPSLDYLIVDSPPGTGDEPLSVCQLIGDLDGSLIVSTPQDVALLDARKTIKFSQMLNVPVLGIIENMSGLICPHCGERIDLFKVGGADKAAKDFGIEMLGAIPIEKEIVDTGDSGRPYIYDFSKRPAAQSMMKIVERIIEKIERKDSAPQKTEEKKEETTTETEDIKIFAFPVSNNRVETHFGHSREFRFLHVKGNEIIKTESLTPPPHEPGVIPRWVSQQGAHIIMTGGMGTKAQSIFEQNGVKVISGIANISPEDAIKHYLEDTLETTDNLCDH